ncbi:hypothetical protein G9A89_015662 [Geosiphon pyriformis]|nr:hypothetical protein G9A89_015662 [Geosiphon pyriformis]
MLRSKGFIKRTKKGNAVKVVQEHYLRDDIWCSAEFCSKCLHTQPALTVAPSASQLFKSHFIIADTNVFMNQIDIIEHPAIQNVIVLQTVCEELRHLSLSIYNRLKNIISDKDRHFYVFSNEHHRETYTERLKDETPNDRNDRAIRMAVKWYSTHLAVLNNNREPVKIVLLSDDLGNREKATKDDLIAVSVRQYVESMVDSPELADMLSNLSTSQETKDKDFTHDEHLSSAQIANGIKSGTFYQGSLSISTHNYLEGSIMANVEGVETQIMIIGRPSMNRAIQGDVVAVQLLPKSEWLRTPTAAVVDEDEESNLSMDTEEDQDSKKQSISEPEEVITLPPQPTGKVVGIIKRKWRPYCGFIKKQSVQGSISSKMSENVLVVTMDRRIPFIRIRTRQAQNIMGQRILVAIDSWPKDSRFPQGHFVRALGAAGDKATETEVLLLEHDVPHQDFSLQVLNDLPFEGANWKMTEDDIRNRADFRNLNICSIDPPGCTDIDDALHVRLLPNGNFEVGVHIADVTHFLKPGTAIDQEAANRGTTVYLVNKRVDMIPFLLGSNLCSLKENVDRLAFSCLWEINPEAEIISVNFTKSVIASKASLTYEEAQRRIDDRRLQDDLTNGIRVLNQLAKKLHAKRLERGALTLASPEVRFQLENDSQDPVDVELKELKETNALVEEFMLLANISVAEKIFSKFPSSSLLRRHPPPANANLENLSKAIAPFGFTLKFDTSKSLADSLNQAELPHEPYFNKLLRIMTTRCMMQAIYFCAGNTVQSNFRHYGLASDIYTHFTSPIRRYADVIVHRLLAACIEPNSVYGSELTDIHKMQSLCEGLNYRHRMAQMAARSSVELHTNIFFKDKIEQEEGFVTRILKNGFIVLVPRYGIEGIVYSSPTKTALAASAPPVVYNPRNNSLDSSTNNVSIKLFDKIIVQITIDEDLVGSAAGGMRQKLKMELLSPQIPGLSLDTIQGKSSARKSNDEAKLAANVKRMKIRSHHN